jgi:20S proteasome alpha/beta subunit
MSQLIACAAQEGVLLAGDSRGVFFESSGEERFISLDRIIPYSSHVVVASAGAIEAHDLCKDFAGFAKGEKITEVNDLIEAAIPYFSGKVDEALRKMCEKLPLDPIINMYLVVAGYSPQAGAQLFVIWDRPKPPKIEYNRVTPIFTLPRRMGLEAKLGQLVNQKAPLSQLAGTTKAALEKLAARDDYVAPPFKLVTVTAQGVTAI